MHGKDKAVGGPAVVLVDGRFEPSRLFRQCERLPPDDTDALGGGKPGVATCRAAPPRYYDFFQFSG